MLMGHYAAAFAARAVEPRLPLGAAFLACQAVDVAWAALVLAGVERGRLDPALPSNPLVLEHMPYTHSLAGTAGFALAAFGVGLALRWPRRVAALFAAAVASHWVLDLVVHRPDLTLFGQPPYLGLRLWDWPLAALLVEIGLVGGTAWLCARREGSARVYGALASVLLVLHLITTFGPVPPSLGFVAAAGLPTFLGLAALAARLDRPA